MTSTKVSTGQIADSAITAAKIADDAVTADKILDGAITAAKVATGVIPAFSAVRQTVQGGPTSSGLPNFWPAAVYAPNTTSLDLSTSGVSSTDPFVVSASQGFGNAAERVGISTTNLTWTALTASRAAATPCYLYVDVAADGSMTTGHTIVAPVYSYTASSGTNTFNITTMTMYTTGTTKGFRVFVGEAETGVGSVSAVVMYAYNGFHDSGYTATIPAAGGLISATHNIGCVQVDADLYIECTTINANYSVGHIIKNPAGINAGYSMPTAYATTRLLASARVASPVSGLSLNDFTSGAATPLTLASWKYKTVVRRAF